MKLLWFLRRRPKGRPISWFCATCAAWEGELHAAWCHRDGVLRAPGPVEGRS